MSLKESTAAILTVLALCVLSASCTQDRGAAAPAGASSAAVPDVEVTPVVSQKLNATVKLPAQLMPYESVEIYPKVTGFVKWIKVDRGSQVSAGEQIALLEAPELVAQRAEAESKSQGAQSQLAAAQAKLAADQSTYQRMSTAAKTPGVVALNDLEMQQKTAEADAANVAALQTAADAARESVRAVSQLESYLTITAPFDGQVTTRYVHPGALVGPAGGPGAMTPIVEIETLTRHRLVVPVPEYDVAGIPEGTEVSFTVPAFPGKTFKAPIARISRAVDLKTRTMPVELDVRDSEGQLDPGTFCDVSWPVRRSYPTLFVPGTAIASDLERSFVVRVHNGHAEWVDVKTGTASGSLMEVFGDLAAGDEVATHGTDQIRPGAAVNPRPAM